MLDVSNKGVFSLLRDYCITIPKQTTNQRQEKKRKKDARLRRSRITQVDKLKTLLFIIYQWKVAQLFKKPLDEFCCVLKEKLGKF